MTLTLYPERSLSTDIVSIIVTLILIFTGVVVCLVLVQKMTPKKAAIWFDLSLFFWTLIIFTFSNMDIVPTIIALILIFINVVVYLVLVQKMTQKKAANISGWFVLSLPFWTLIIITFMYS